MDSDTTLRQRKQTFIDTFVAAFLAAYTAQIYTEACANDEHGRLYNPPVEDAIDIAEQVWLKVNQQLTR